VLRLAEQYEPTISQKERKVLGLVDRLWADSATGLTAVVANQSGVPLSLWDIRERNERRYLGDHHDNSPKPGLKQATINRIGTAVNTIASVQTEQPWRLKLTPQQTDDPPVGFLTDAGIREIKRLMAMPDPTTGAPFLSLEGFDNQQYTAATPIDPAHLEALETLLQFNPLLGRPPLEEGRHLVLVNDGKAAEYMELIAAAKLKEAFSDYYTIEAETMSNITGDQAVLFEWDDEAQQVRLTTPNWTNYRYDPRSSWIQDAKYAFLDYRLPVVEALELYPDFADDINALTSDGGDSGLGTPSMNKEGGSSTWGHGGGDQYRSDRAKSLPEVTIRTLWRVGRMVPLTKEEAISKKHVTEEVDEGLEYLNTKISPASAKLLLTKTNEPVSPEDPRWPKKHGIRQIVVLAYRGQSVRVLEDIESPFPKIPMPYIKNIPIPHSPYGQGEPFRLEDIAQLINRLASAILNVLRYNQYPEQVLPQTVYDFLTTQAQDMGASTGLNLHGYPGRTLKIPDEMWLEYFGRRDTSKGFYVEPPEVPASWINLLMALLNEHQVLAGDVDVLSGQSPGSESSGVALDTLQQAGGRVMQYKAKTMEWCFEWISHLTIWSIIELMEDAEWDKYLGNLGPSVRSAYRQRMKNLQYDLVVEAIQGRGQNRRLAAAKADNMFDRQAISQETYLDMQEHPNPRREMRKQVQEITTKQNMMTPPAAMGGESTAPPAANRQERLNGPPNELASRTNV